MEDGLQGFRHDRHGSTTYHGDTYEGSMQMKMRDQDMSAKMTGKFLGACDGTEVNTKK